MTAVPPERVQQVLSSLPRAVRAPVRVGEGGEQLLEVVPVAAHVLLLLVGAVGLVGGADGEARVV